jgi:predicted small lipoprotein YifL
MRISSFAPLAAVLALAACGGKVAVDLPSGAGGAPSVTGTGGAPTDPTTTGGLGGTLGGCVGTCKEALFNGGVPCGGAALKAYQGVEACVACTGAGVCHVECDAVCQGQAASADCITCFSPACPMIYNACLDN